MSVTRFAAFRFKENVDSKKREEVFKRHLELYKSRSYVLEVEGQHGKQASGQGYDYAFLIKFQSVERMTYYADEDPEHVLFKKEEAPYFDSIFAWAFPVKN